MDVLIDLAGDDPAGDDPAVQRRVLVIDDHRSFAEALSIAIDTQPDLHCIGVAGTGAEGLAAAVRWRPDAVLVDMRLPDMTGPELVSRLREMDPRMHLLALTAYADPASVAAAATAGVRAFLRKECSVQSIVDQLRTAGEGPMAIDGETLGAMLTAAGAPAAGAVEVDGIRLTPREHEVLDLLAQAYDARGIARRLGISLHTIRGYVKSILAKLDAHTQLEAVIKAKQCGLVTEVPVRRPRALPAREVLQPLGRPTS